LQPHECHGLVVFFQPKVKPVNLGHFIFVWMVQNEHDYLTTGAIELVNVL